MTLTCGLEPLEKQMVVFTNTVPTINVYSDIRNLVEKSADLSSVESRGLQNADVSKATLLITTKYSNHSNLNNRLTQTEARFSEVLKATEFFSEAVSRIRTQQMKTTVKIQARIKTKTQTVFHQAVRHWLICFGKGKESSLVISNQHNQINEYILGMGI